MRTILDGAVEFYGDRVKLVKTLMKRQSPEEFPELLKWALQTLYFSDGRWIEICRIDNYPHEGRVGSHVHYYGREDVRRVPLGYEGAKEEIKAISARILKEKFGEVNHGL